jgi:hypothetical protein
MWSRTHVTYTVCAAIFIVLLVAAVYGAERVSGSLCPTTVCLTHPAVVEACVPIDTTARRDLYIERLCRNARSRMLLFSSFTDLEAARSVSRLASTMAAGVPWNVYYDIRPLEPERRAIDELMAGLPGSVTAQALKRRTVYMGRFPFLHTASTHYKVAAADDRHFVTGSANALKECYYMNDEPRATCTAAHDHFLAPAFLEFDVAISLSEPVRQICDYLEVIAQQTPWAERSVHITLADRCEFHIFPAGVLSRDGFLAGVVESAATRVTVMALSVWPTGEFRVALTEAVARGCRVTLVGSAYECSKSQQLLSRLNRCAAYRERWEYREWTPRDGLVHAKFMLVDDTVVLPSFNFSYKSVAGAVDDETAVVLRGLAAEASRHALEHLLDTRTVAFSPPQDRVGTAMLAVLNPLM